MTSSVKSIRTCGDCQFFTPTLGFRGDCRRLSPVMFESSTRWPQVSAATLVCGEFKPNGQNQTVQEDLIDWDIFSTRVKGALRRALILSWDQLQQLETNDLLAIPGIGAVAAKEITEARDARQLKNPAQKHEHANEEAS